MIRLIKFKGLKELKEDEEAMGTCWMLQSAFTFFVYWGCPIFETCGLGIQSVLAGIATGV